MAKKHEDKKDDGCHGFTPAIGKVVIVASSDENEIATLELRENCICFSEKTRFKRLVCSSDPHARAVAHVLVPGGEWRATSLVEDISGAPALLEEVARSVDVTEVATLLVSEKMRQAIIDRYQPRFKPFFPRKGGARILLFSFDGANNFLGLSEFSN